MKELSTERLLLREWCRLDTMDLHEYGIDELVGPSAGWKPHKDIEETKNILDMFIKDKTIYAIEHKEDKKVIGGIGLHKRCPDATLRNFNQREIGFVLNSNYWGRGIVPEATNRIIRYGFEELELDLIWCGHYEDNVKSKRVNEKCGFKFRFIKDQTIKLLDDKKVKVHYYSYSKEDYFNNK